MARWNWWCTMMLISGLWVAYVASAADQDALFAEGILTSVDLSQENPTITLRRSTGDPLILRLGRIGAWESLEVGAEVKLRYTEQGGVYAIESMEITRPVHAAVSVSPVASPPSPPTPTTAVEQSPAQPSTVDSQLEQETTDRREKKPDKKKR